MARLILQTKEGEKVFPLDKKVTYLGRKSTCEIVINETAVSRYHARIINDANDYLIVDTQSRNGTLVNGQKIPQKFLSNNDFIQIGSAHFNFFLDPKDKEPGFSLTRYDIIEKIGRGGMGHVYKARQKSMDRIVALKILNKRFTNDKDFVERFIKEAQAAGKLSHPNIIHVHDVSKESDLYYFSMEYVSGKTIMGILLEQGAFEPGWGLEIIKQVAKALEFSHSNGIIHRDIKPDNIMVSDNNEVKLADLGIARNLNEANDEIKKKTIYGTPLYMAPEQAMGKQVDHRMDIYSLGATFYHMVVGDPPFQANSALELLKKHINEPLTPPNTVSPDIPANISNLIVNMMAKLPENRYASAREVIDEIELIQKGGKVSSKRLVFSETSILRKLSSGIPLEPSVNVVGFDADESVRKLIALDPRKRLKIVFIVLFIIGLIGVFLLTIYLSDMLKKNIKTPAPVKEEPQISIEDLSEKARMLQEKADLVEELKQLDLLYSALSGIDPKKIEIEKRIAFLKGFFTIPESSRIIDKHLENYSDIMQYVSETPEAYGSIILLAKQCLNSEFTKLFPVRAKQIQRILTEYRENEKDKVLQAEIKLFKNIEEVVSKESHDLSNLFERKHLASKYIETFKELNSDHFSYVSNILKNTIESIETIQQRLRESRNDKINMLSKRIKNSHENREYSSIYLLYENYKDMYKDVEWRKKVKEIFKEYEKKISNESKPRLKEIENIFLNRQYKKAFSKLYSLKQDYDDTPFSDEIHRLDKKMKRDLEQAYFDFVKSIKGNILNFEYTKILKEKTCYIGTKYEILLDQLSKDFEALNDLWSYLTKKGDKINIKLPITIMQTTKRSIKNPILDGIRAEGIYYKFTKFDNASMLYKMELLSDTQLYHIFKNILQHTQAPLKYYQFLLIYCKLKKLTSKQEAVRALIEQEKKKAGKKD